MKFVHRGQHFQLKADRAYEAADRLSYCITVGWVIGGVGTVDEPPR
jgi:hypothetical protein